MYNSKEVHIYHANAGSGKTHKLMDIIEEHVKAGTPLTRIAFVTFTRAAADVAKDRVCRKFNIPLKDAPHFRTIHSMCFQALNYKSDRVMDTEKYEDFGIKAGYAFGKMGGKRTLDDVDWKNMSDAQLVAFEQLYRSNQKQAQWLLDNKIDNIDFTRYCVEYTRYKRTFEYVDFTDMLEQYIAEDKYEDVDIACIDEAQDCSPLQWQVLFKAFRNAKYIYVVGDVKQNIYTFSGADSDILLKLRGEQHHLDISYRVPQNIHTFVQEHIVKDMINIVPQEPKSFQQGGEISYISTLDEIPILSNQKSYLFLARNRKFLQNYVNWCQEKRIPYSVFGNPVFTPTEKTQFREGKTEDWTADKLRLAQEYYQAGTLYYAPFVRIDTIHGVKGDEADEVVLMPDLSRLTWKEYDNEPNNEHKVFYVAVTRAREKLYILQPHTKYYYAYLF